MKMSVYFFFELIKFLYLIKRNCLILQKFHKEIMRAFLLKLEYFYRDMIKLKKIYELQKN